MLNIIYMIVPGATALNYLAYSMHQMQSGKSIPAECSLRIQCMQRQQHANSSTGMAAGQHLPDKVYVHLLHFAGHWAL